MAATLDELLDRAELAERRAKPELPFRSELMAQLEAALDEVDQRFPDGAPTESAPGLDKLEHTVLMLRIETRRKQLEYEPGFAYREDPPHLKAVDDA